MKKTIKAICFLLTGFSQWAAVKKLHPALKTIVPQVAVMPGYDAPMENNVPFGNTLGWANDNIYKNKHPFEIINYGSGKPVSEETIKDAGDPLQIKWHKDSFIKIPIWKD